MIVVVKLLLLWLCKSASNKREISGGGVDGTKSLQSIDPTLEALSQDHLNDAQNKSFAMIKLLLALYCTQNCAAV